MEISEIRSLLEEAQSHLKDAAEAFDDGEKQTAEMWGTRAMYRLMKANTEALLLVLDRLAAQYLLPPLTDRTPDPSDQWRETAS